MAGEAKIRLTIPRQDLAEFMPFRLTRVAAREWAMRLPVTRIEAAAQLLLETLTDLNRYRISPETRFEILEALRQNVDTALTRLSKRYLNQPLVMPDEPRQMAELGNQLLAATGTGYTIVAVEAIQQRDSLREMNAARLTCESIHRALLHYNRAALQTFQLYKPLRMHGWRVLHQLFALAESQQLADLPVPEPLWGASTIRATYLQCILLGCCKLNQLRQTDMALVFNALREWAGLVSLLPPGSEGGLFVVDINSDQPPLYSSLHTRTALTHSRYINTAKLIDQLYQAKAGAAAKELRNWNQNTLPPHIIDHLITSLGNMSMRNFKRTPTQAPLRVCLGLSSTHYHVAGGRHFEALLSGSRHIVNATPTSEKNPFMLGHEPIDAWQMANPDADHLRHADQRTAHPEERIEYDLNVDASTRARFLEEVDIALPQDERYPVFNVPLADASPGGYCLQWTRELPGDVRTGDIVGLKEEHSHDWVIAVIRWLSRLESSRTLIGLELLSPRALPFGAIIHQADGSKTPPMRALLLPEIKLVGQPETLLTPYASFRERQRITLINGRESHTVQLVNQVAGSPGYSRFEFRYVKELGDVIANEHQHLLESPYDSVWSKI
ncbi:MAG: hypothetical protein KDI09_08865 [Halioglobus sp.]|nr:hypothetical protein [Halioglobus sp.]